MSELENTHLCLTNSVFKGNTEYILGRVYLVKIKLKLLLFPTGEVLPAKRL